MSDILIDITHSLEKYELLYKTDKTENYEVFFVKNTHTKAFSGHIYTKILNESKYQKLQMRASLFFFVQLEIKS